ncbi:glycosyltransferase family 4 protein [Neobacillus sp. YX16]|uniref:glycosyltransferase family 4 protein n=1 Tax=Neobacillus sp. YX16 TaxID=3047874 RepID=UPI0024C41DBC|nr:glycosyltransferase family 4 protein [Neobacillus sp. YX16]WHZ02851.1 glycosyltransferase family 4 protein [Neobacillus sp. YX16]
MKKKKILLIHHSGLLGGAGISLYNTWKTLVKNYEVTCYIPNDPPELLTFLREKGLNPSTFTFRLGKLTYYSGGNNLLQPRFWYHALHSITQIKYWYSILKKEKPDLVLVNSKVLCWMGLLLRKTKSLCFVRETIPGSPNKLMNKIMRSMLDEFSAVAFLSQYDLLQTNLKKAKTVVAPDYLDIEEYRVKNDKELACVNLNINPRSFNVLFVGGTDRLKGIDLAVRAISILKNENINLVVAGKDVGKITGKGIRRTIIKFKNRHSVEFSKQIKAIIKQKSIGEKVNFVGIQKDMADIYSACDILIFPMKEPHQARPAFEIGVQKKPVIITDFPNIKEFVEHGVNGLTFEPNNPEALAEAILKLKNDNDLLKKLGNLNYEYTINYHTEKYAMSRLINKIEEII